MPENKFGLADDFCTPMKDLATAFEKVLSYIFINKENNISKTKNDDSENIIRELLFLLERWKFCSGTNQEFIFSYT